MQLQLQFSVNLCEIFPVEMCMTWILTFRMAQGKMYICQSKGHMRLPMCWQLQCLLCHRLQDIYSQNVHDLDLVLHNVQRSNVNIPIEMRHATFCVGNSNVCTFCHRLLDILSRNVHDFDLDL